jgi:hypothetical protein
VRKRKGERRKKEENVRKRGYESGGKKEENVSKRKRERRK